MKNRFFLLIIAFGFNTICLKAQSPCNTTAHQQFDFWVGEWDVYDTQGDTIVGKNIINKILNDCVVMENWTGSTGFEGKSFNTYNVIDSTWNQVWVDMGGATYHFKGKMVNGVMKMKGKTSRPDGTIVFFEMNYTPNPKDKTVRQLWRQSVDKGANWSVIFDGIYKKKK